MDDEIVSVMFDNGSGMFKAGFIGEETPRVVFPTVSGQPRLDKILSFEQDVFVGDKALSNRAILKLTNPIERGIVTNWNDLETIWYHTFQQGLSVRSDEHPVILTEVSLNPKSNREKLTQIMFETFSVPAGYVLNSAFAVLYASDKTTGIVLDSGHGVTQVVPFNGGHPLMHSIVRANFAGQDLTEYMERLLTERGYYCKTSDSQQTARKIKEQLCYVTLDFEQEMSTAAPSSTLEKSFELPSGQSIQIGNERFRCAEALFQPELVGIHKESLPEMIVKSIQMCDSDIHKYLYENIVVSGGCTMLPGFVERLQKEITKLAPSAMKIKIIASPERKYSAWIGGSIFGSLSEMPRM